MSFRTCWGRVEKFLVAGEQEIIHTKPFFFPVVSAATCTNHHLEVDQRWSIRLAEAREEEMQCIFDDDSSVENRSNLNCDNASLRHALHCQEIFWAQKARVQWINDGDKNTAFYHVVVLGRATLINSVLKSIPVYTAAAISIPKTVVTYIEKACALVVVSLPMKT
ncbi:hypothetical protein Taro_032906 [Colocasia esculenta]|uniref:Uncharacterized protein n=1 Tax=Colocasia esculenta TaxID=4460 RepID=A0A843W7G6_COLES|nr:hypothetical protein [Colocasia esculenta]